MECSMEPEHFGFLTSAHESQLKLHNSQKNLAIRPNETINRTFVSPLDNKEVVREILQDRRDEGPLKLKK